jgi:hypothetical protein
MATTRGKQKPARRPSPRDGHLARMLRGACDCAECEEQRRLARCWAEVARRQDEERRAREEVLALARRIPEATWNQEHAPRVWVRLDGRRWADPWTRACPPCQHELRQSTPINH